MHCIYCKSNGPFNKEHVIPQSLGSFSPINPTIQSTDGLVCKNCNSVTFSALETEFKEDSWEGVTGQMLNVTGSNSVRILGNNVTMKCFSGIKDSFFDEIFPFLKLQNQKFVIDVKPQVRIRNYGGEDGYQVFSVEALERIKNESTLSKTKLEEFNRVKDRLKMSGKNNVAIFTGGNDPNDNTQLNQAITLIREYGITYNENQRKFTEAPRDPNVRFEVGMEGKITPNACRLIAKVAFNYFSFGSLQDKMQGVLYQQRFDQIKKFVLGKNNIIREEVIVEVSDDPITIHDKLSGNRFPGHTIVFFEEGGKIFSRLTFFGGKVYKVLLGECPDELLNSNFGCGHLFNPFDHSIHNLTQQPKINPSEEEVKQSFGLYRRIDLSGLNS